MTRRANPAQAALFDEPAADTIAAGFTPLAQQFDALPADWKAILTPCIAQANWPELCAFVDGERAAGKPIFPTDVFRALHLTSVDDVRVVILGQDPYHGTGTVDGREIPQAHGLAFSVPAGVRVPPSLRNIYKEIESDLGIRPARHGFLEHWADQGVLLLNSVLTVEMSRAASHQGKGWETFTDAIVRLVNDKPDPVVFLLWGAYAQRKAGFVDASRHLVLKAPHPSPLSAHNGVFGCRHFSKTNAFLEAKGLKPIDWALPADPLAAQA